jgi:hypothetical protein
MLSQMRRGYESYIAHVPDETLTVEGSSRGF